MANEANDTWWDEIKWGAGQVVGFGKGAKDAAWELVEFAGKTSQYATDNTFGFIGDIYSYASGEPAPVWMPSGQRGQATSATIVSTAGAIWDNPGLIWEGIKAPYVEAWAEGRYGEAIGRGTFEAVTAVLGAKGVDKVGKLGAIGSKLSKADDIADVLTVARRADTVVPDEFAGIADELINLKRAEGKLGDVVDGARQSGTLDDLLDLGKLTPEEIDDLEKAGKLSKAEADKARKAASGGVTVTREGAKADSESAKPGVKSGKVPDKLNLTYPVETSLNTAFFWSGKTNGVGGETVARKIATDNKGTTLEALIENRNIQMPTWDATNPEVVQAWKAVSADYATGASGTVRAVIGQNLRLGNVWETVELPALMKNPNVDRIITIDPVTKVETEIFVRANK